MAINLVPLLALIALPVAFATAQSATEQPGSIEGHVLDASTGTAVRKPILTLIRQGAKPEFRVTRGDASGRFVARNLPAGVYTISAGGRGYLLSRSSNKVSLTTGHTIRDVVLRLTPASSLTGRVTDVDGDPLTGAQIRLWKQTWCSGTRELTSIFEGKTQTDDRGIFRLASLPAGSYYVSAFVPESPSLEDSARFARVFYPGVLDAAMAAPVILAPGSELENVNLKLVQTVTVRLQGHVTNDPSARIRLMMEDGASENDHIAHEGAAHNGKFELKGLLPGTYQVVARSGADQSWVRTSITIGPADVEGFTLRIPPAASITGRVRHDKQKDVDLSQLRIRIQPAFPNFVVYGSPTATLGKDGSFRFVGLAPDTYTLNLGNSGGLYIKELRSDNRALPGQVLNLNGSADIEVVLGTSATVTGTVRSGASRQPAAGTLVILVPEENDRRGQIKAYGSATADAAGTFTISGVVPGKYRALAFERAEDVVRDCMYMDPQFIANWQSNGVALTLEEGGRPTIELNSTLPSTQP